METGLRHRLKRVVRQMSDQHRHLRVIHAELADALSGRESASEAQERFAHYREAVEAHFALESDTFFPAVHGLRADLGTSLEALDRAHDELREMLSRLEGRVQAGSTQESARALADFAGVLRDHEAIEEELLMGLVDEALGGKTPSSEADG
jgi:hemerythrin-like domain-containing protein